VKNSKFKIQNLLIITFLALLFFSLVPVQAALEPLVPCGPGTAKPKCELCDFFVLLNNVINFFLLRIVLPVATLILVIGGLMFMIAYFGGAEMLPGGVKGGPALLSQAKRVITSVVIGLILIFAAWLILGSFFQVIGLANWTKNIYQNWWQKGFFEIPCP